MAVRRRGKSAIHYVAAPLDVDSEVRVTVDWARRWDHMQQHSGRVSVYLQALKYYGFDELTGSKYYGIDVLVNVLTGSKYYSIDVHINVLTCFNYYCIGVLTYSKYVGTPIL